VFDSVHERFVETVAEQDPEVAKLIETFTEIDSAYYMDRAQALSALDEAGLRRLMEFGRTRGRITWFLRLANDAESELARRTLAAPIP
jgi:hypothetical protein